MAKKEQRCYDCPYEADKADALRTIEERLHYEHRNWSNAQVSTRALVEYMKGKRE